MTHISTADNDGGAARAAFKIHQGVMKLGIQSRMLVGSKVEKHRKEIEQIPRQGTLAEKAFCHLVAKTEQVTGAEYLLIPWGRSFLRHPFYEDAQIIHLHNLHGGYFPVSLLPKISAQKRVVWSINDMWPHTGHCYYPGMYGCERWKIGCGSCPGLKQDMHYPLTLDTTKLLWKNKQRLYSASPMHLVAHSKWSFDQLAESPLLNAFPRHYIPLGFDTATFSPKDKRAVRSALGIPAEKNVILFAATGIQNERKGYSYLLEALEKLSPALAAKSVLLILGHGAFDESRASGMERVQFKNINDDRIYSMVLSAADILVAPSIWENFGQIFAEAAACETVSVAFDTSGVRDIVGHMKSGYLAELRSSDDLARGIHLLLENKELRLQMAAAGRRLVETEFSLELQARRYHDLYSDILASA